MKSTILLVEDESSIREMIAYTLSKSGFDVLQAETPTEAFSQIADHNPQLILIDWMLPDQSGIEIIRRLRRENYTKNIPIIMLTAKSEENDKVWGLEAGADDYITKPFSPKELIARIQSLLRRANTEVADKVIKAGNIILDPNNHKVTVDGRNVSLGPKEFKLLKFFLTHQNKVFSRNQLLDSIWGQNTYVEERTVDVHILRLRKSIKSESTNYIQTIRGAGYIFSA